MLLKFTYYVQYYALEQEVYYSVVMNGIKVYHMLDHTLTVLLEYIDHSLQFSTNA